MTSILDPMPWPLTDGARDDLRFQAQAINRPTWGLSLSCQRGGHQGPHPWMNCQQGREFCLCSCHDVLGGPSEVDRELVPVGAVLPEKERRQ